MRPLPKPPAARKSAVKGPTIPYIPALWPITKSIDLAVTFQQLCWLSEEYGDEEGWHFFSLTELSKDLGGVATSTVDRWLRRLRDLGLVERCDWQDDLGHFAYRPDRARLQQLGPRLALRDGRWNGTPSPSQNGTGVPLPESDGGVLSTRTHTRDVDLDVEREVDTDNDNDQHVRSEAPKEDNSTGEVGIAYIDYTCTSCGGVVKRGDGLLRDLHQNPFHPTCLREGVGS